MWISVRGYLAGLSFSALRNPLGAWEPVDETEMRHNQSAYCSIMFNTTDNEKNKTSPQ